MNNDDEENTLDDAGDASRVTHLLDSARRYFYEGQYPQVLSATALALQINPDCIEAVELRILVKKCMLDYAGLLADCTELIRLRPDQARPYIDRADAFIRLGQPERAILDCTRALEIAPDSAEVQSMAFDGAETLEAPSNSAMAYETRAHAYLLLGLVDEYHADLRKGFLLTANPETISKIDRRNLVTNLLSRAQSLMESGEYGQAVEACSAVLCDEPEHVRARWQRGIAYQRLGRFEESCHDLAKAWQLRRNRNRVGRSYVVTLQGSSGETNCAVFPSTSKGRCEALHHAERLAKEEQIQSQFAECVGQAFVVNVYHAVGNEIEKKDWIWIKREDDVPPKVVRVDISNRMPPFE